MKTEFRPLRGGHHWFRLLTRAIARCWPFAGYIERSYFLVGAPVFFQSLRAACQVNLFGLLSKRPGLTLPEIATETGLAEYPVRVLLLTCVTMRLLSKRGDRYYASRLARRALDPERPGNRVAAIEWVHHIAYPSMFHYLSALKESRAAGLDVFPGEGDNLYVRLAQSPHLETAFHDGMAARSRISNQILSETVRFDQYPKLLDVGGGNGENLSAIARRHPGIHGTLLDFPTVTDRAAERFAREGMADRLNVVGRNFLAEEFPGGFQAILMAHLTPIFSPDVNRDLLQKAHRALNPEGLLCLCAPLMRDDETGPFDSAFLSPYFLCAVNGQGRHYSFREIRQWLEECGFVDVRSSILTETDSVIVARRP